MSGGHTTDKVRSADGSPPQLHRAAPPQVDRRREPKPTIDPWFDSAADGYASFGDADTPAEVDAVFRLQRRIAVAYFVTFVFVTLGVGVAIVTLNWAATSQVFGGFSPGFALAAIGLYLFFVIVAVGAASLANSIEDRMMGASTLRPERPRS